ncbi:undecaprenol kinase [Paenibacillus sp. oral taxon 786 str. D14]|uniref:diacylglycerol kinase family protein n=1 Tax=unclassified Paenibacillus TaxID=185978 RepID=UPI0001AFDAA5|nr:MULTISPECIES: diacylglycerol kinase [unclassified Paenibacillus]EES72439.1 undecaprenol kinase [Paenibacillus sp. oral taxon 786 str. D14]MCT2194853.1 diacylglycerol kinase [Paenibacillus sp. p3-SID1389]
MKPSRRWSSSFRYALEGIATSLRTQRHVRFHCVAAVIVIAAAIALSLPARDVALLLLVIALVISLELVNTAIEAVVDLAAPEWHRLGKIAKDAAAGAVLVAAVFAVVIGILIFYEPLMRCLGLL